MNTNKVILVKPYKFKFNIETAKDNIYQSDKGNISEDEVQRRAEKEFENAVDILRKEGIHVDVIEDYDDKTPDSIFPNNVFVTFPKKLFIAEMFSENRKLEYDKISKDLKKLFDFSKIEIIDFRNEKGKVLEGTGAVVIDRFKNIAYGSISKRCDRDEFLRFCEIFNLKPIAFKAKQRGEYIYHTNVMMMVAKNFVMIADEFIVENKEEVINTIKESGKEIISLNDEEILAFAGNAIELKGKDKDILVISESGLKSLHKDKIKIIEKYDKIVPINVDTISHYGGGAIRCMIAENFI